VQSCIALEQGRRCPRPAALGAVFCDVHMQAPPGRRGGWLSAWKRKVAMAPSPIGTHHPSVTPYTDFSNVAPPSSSLKLYVGGRPPHDRELAFDTLVLCERHYQPERMVFRGTIVRCPIDDDVLSKQEIRQVLNTSSRVAADLRQGKRVLVACRAGINRSALVASLALAQMTRMTAPELVAHMKQRRHHDCLFNQHFQIYLHRFIEGSRRPSGAGRSE
jgi:protein-tyrosine phosphatase